MRFPSQTKRGKKDDDAATQEGAGDGDHAAAPVKKKKKRSKGAIANNPHTLNGEFDVNDCLGAYFNALKDFSFLTRIRIVYSWATQLFINNWSIVNL